MSIITKPPAGIFTCKIRCVQKKKYYIICFFAVSHTPEAQLPLRQLTEISSNQCAVACGKNIMLS